MSTAMRCIFKVRKSTGSSDKFKLLIPAEALVNSDLRGTTTYSSPYENLMRKKHQSKLSASWYITKIDSTYSLETMYSMTILCGTLTKYFL